MAHPFKKFIQKDQLKTYPLKSFDGDILFFHTLCQEERFALLQELDSQKVLGLDTETKPSFTKGIQNPLALLQIYLPHRVILFQLRKYSLPTEICNIIENPSITKVGVGLRDDIRGLRRDFNCEPVGMLDLNQFAKKKRFQSIGVQKLFLTIFNTSNIFLQMALLNRHPCWLYMMYLLVTFEKRTYVNHF